MTKRVVLYFLLSFSCILSSYSQVHLQTGSATFSLPLFNWQDDKSRLNSIVALNYSSGSGLRVDELASNVGQGWSLLAGGMISRIQVGEPDDQKAYPNGSSSETDITKYPNGYLYGTVPVANGCPVALTKYPIYGYMNQLYAQHNLMGEDKQLDYFSFQFNGKVGMFVLDTTGGDHGVSLGDTKMKISFQRDETMANGTYNGTRTTITSFTIQDVDGLIYRFTTKEKSRVLETDYCNWDLTQVYSQPKIKRGHTYHQKGSENTNFKNDWVINGWYLTEIEDAVTHRKVQFSYQPRNLDTYVGVNITFDEAGDFTLLSHKRSIAQSQEISTITYPDGHVATVNYGNDRADFPGQKAISSIDVTYQGRYLSRHILKTSYIIRNRYGTPLTNNQKSRARLYLLSVQKIGVDLKEDTPPYKFDYYLGTGVGDDIVPSPYLFAKDNWGYYNGNNSKDFSGLNVIPLDRTWPQMRHADLTGLCFLREGVTGVLLNAKTGYAKNGLLKQIVYPTGGSLTYEYQQNTGKFNGESDLNTVGGVYVSKTSSSDGGYSNGCGNAISTSYNYLIGGVGSDPSIWALERPLNSYVNTNHFSPEKRKWKYPAGGCYWKYQYPGIMNQSQSASVSWLMDKLNGASVYLDVLSLVSNVIDVIQLASATTGPAAVIIDVITTLINVAITCIHDFSQDKSTTIYQNQDLNGVSPLPVQFKKVEVVENPGTIGKAVHWFTSDVDYPIWSLSNSNFTSKQRFAPWAYGLPLRDSIFDVNGNLIKTTYNDYDFDNAKSTVSYCESGHLSCPGTVQFTRMPSVKCLVLTNFSQRNVDWSDPTKYQYGYATSDISGTMNVEFYAYYTGRTLLRATHDQTYRPNDPTKSVETATTYSYNTGANFEVRSIGTVQSNGDVNYKSFTYSSDYNPTSGVLLTMKNNNMVVMPITTTTSVQLNSGGGLKYTGEKVVEYIQLANGDIKPSKTWEQRFAAPIDQSSFTPYSLTGSMSGYANPQAFSYDANGNLVSITDEANRYITNLYDYNDKYIVGTVINANASTTKSAYTSFETANLGGWTIPGSPSYNFDSVVTGSRSLKVGGSANISASGLNTSKQYYLTFWAKASTFFFGSQTLTLITSGPVINGLTFYHYKLASGVSSVTMTISNSKIDELRLYPTDARMRTVTYDPLLGKTSECDENNRVTYYEYDNLGRLRFIKDDNRNIVKMYEYNNVSALKQTGCPAIFYNNFVSEIFTRSNCSVGYAGGDVTFSVPANTFSSTISQADADAKAENYILTNGQTYADGNGGCLQIYYNTLQSQSFITQTCNPGYDGGTVTYTVSANKYSSTVSQADADQQAIDEIEANGQVYANAAAHQNCIATTVPDWTFKDDAPSYCQSVGGVLPAHFFVFETDVNPFSPSYNQTRWTDVGPQDECPSGLYFSVVRSQLFTRNNCTGGTVGGSVTYTVPAGKYSSPTSQAAADQLAIDDLSNNGQAYANANAPCLTLRNITYSDSRSFQYDVRFTENTSGTVYNFTANANTTGTLGQVPDGTYTVFICPINNPNPNNNYNVLGNILTGMVCGSFYNITVSGTGNIQIY